MGKVFSMISRKANRFNVENRAERIISKDKPTPAPKYPSTQKEIDILMKENKGAFEELKGKNERLNENLKSVYVTSTAVDMSKFGKPSDRNRFPSKRSPSVDSEFGYEEPEVIPAGRFTLKQALRVLTDKNTPNDVTAEKIAQALNINVDDAAHLVNYFSSLKLHMPETAAQLGVVDKAKKAFLKPLIPTKVVSFEATPTSLQLENKTPAKPD